MIIKLEPMIILLHIILIKKFDVFNSNGVEICAYKSIKQMVSNVMILQFNRDDINTLQDTMWIIRESLVIVFHKLYQRNYNKKFNLDLKKNQKHKLQNEF